MPFHFCTDELIAIIAMLPFIGYYFNKLHTWYHLKFKHKCHEISCQSTHVKHEESVIVVKDVESKARTNVFEILADPPKLQTKPLIDDNRS